MKKQTPILFSTVMVQALLAGRKSMTRRMKGLEEINKNPDAWYLNTKKWVNPTTGIPWALFTNESEDRTKSVKCPYGIEGDLLWVKETFAPVPSGMTRIMGGEYFFKADGTIYLEGGGEYTPKWKSSLFMKKETVRLWYEITDIKLERLHWIIDDEAIEEGIECKNVATGGDDYQDYYRNYLGSQEESEWPWFAGNPIESFKSLWIKINGQASWDSNPWLWVVSFKPTVKP